MAMKLGLKIVKSLNGYQEVAEINGDKSWTKNVKDTRDDCKVIDGLQNDSKASVIMYTADTCGEYYTIVSLIDGRVNDFISAWVFRPWGLEIPGKDFLALLNSVRDEILANEINEEHLVTLFSKEYNQSSASVSPICTEGLKSAVRYYNKKGADYTILEVFERGISQKINSNYKAIFLVDGTYSLDASACDDITSSVLEKSVIVDAPSSKIVSDAFGFVPYVNNKEFSSSISSIVGERISVIWKKECYKDIEVPCLVKESGCDIRAPFPNEIKRIIKYSDIEVYATDGTKVSGYSLKVCDRVLQQGSQLEVSESAIKDAKVVVSCDGYADYSDKMDLSKKVSIFLKAKSYQYKYITRDREDNDIKIIIDTNKKYIETPLKGYTSGGTSPSEKSYVPLSYKPEGYPKKFLIIISSIALCLGIALGGFITWRILENFNPSDVKQETKKSSPSYYPLQTPSTPAVDSLSLAITYLDNHDQWKRSDMESYPDLRGLWDELNGFKFKEIKQRSNLMESKRLGNVVAKIEELLLVTNNNPRSILKGAKYNNEDEIITIDNRGTKNSYINTLNNKIEEAKNPPAQEKTRSGRVTPSGNRGNNRSSGGSSSEPQPSTTNDNGLSDFEG